MSEQSGLEPVIEAEKQPNRLDARRPNFDIQHKVQCISLRTVPTNSKVFLRDLLNMWEMQILTSVIEIQKENWG